jgi:lipoprotein signal peptidase
MRQFIKYEALLKFQIYWKMRTQVEQEVVQNTYFISTGHALSLENEVSQWYSDLITYKGAKPSFYIQIIISDIILGDNVS